MHATDRCLSLIISEAATLLALGFIETGLYKISRDELYVWVVILTLAKSYAKEMVLALLS